MQGQEKALWCGESPEARAGQSAHGWQYLPADS
jgi:hypothetical protein